MIKLSLSLISLKSDIPLLVSDEIVNLIVNETVVFR